MSASVSYMASAQDQPFFFSAPLIDMVKKLSQALDCAQIKLYPDATLKTNRLPTGILCESNFYSTYLFPFILRDPGCGFLTFKIRFQQQPENNWHYTIGKQLNDLFNQATMQEKLSLVAMPEITDMMNEGIDAYSLTSLQREKFFHKKFPTDSKVILSTEKITALHTECLNITNTLEIRSFDDVSQMASLSAQDIDVNDFIGFIHSGSCKFPKILHDEFTHSIAQYCDDHHLFTLAQIDAGLFGIPIFSELGKKYQCWLNAAMNFALANRYASFLLLKNFLEHRLPCEVVMINDRIHAGLFVDASDTSEQYFMSRGVQQIPASDLASPHNLTVHAGHRETIAALVTGTKTANWTAHGSGEHILENYGYQQHFDQKTAEHYMHSAKNAYYNTVPAFNKLLSLTFNTLRAIYSLEYGEICQKAAILLPLINIHGQLLMA